MFTNKYLLKMVDKLNLKTTYHYSYFIYPFLVSNGRYGEFINKFLSDNENWSFTIRDNEKDINTHAYYLPYVKRFLFPTLYWDEDLKHQYERMPLKKKLDIVSKLTCVNFQYKINESKKNNYKFNNTSINFEILKIELICFEPGICFLVLKTELDKADGVYSNDILDFNYKFRTINPRYQKKKKSDGMFIMNKGFNGVEDLSDFINHLLHGYEDVEKENIYFDRLFTYSYMCLDEDEWNEQRDLSEITNEFYKFLYVLPGEYGSQLDSDFIDIKDNTYTKWAYSKYGFSRESGVVFSSERESFNRNKLPVYYESMYFYIFLLAFYQRIALILFSQELMNSGTSKIENLKRRFTKFTHFSWFSQITNSEQGMDIWKKWQQAFDLPALFDEVQKEYSEFYDYTVARGQENINLLLIIIYTVSLIFSAMTLLVDYKILNANNHAAKVFLLIVIALTIAMYPIYLIGKMINKRLWKNSRKHFL
ncbi:MAG: hypothetical protein Q8936_09725 [Bacillota bacterium]|nr:hypothetical protein [Bacillota bacterium]